jgi:valyl-tRNA synthetase
VFYPTSLLITGFDILFFWVARMIMLGCWFMSPPEKPETGGRGADAEARRAGPNAAVEARPSTGESMGRVDCPPRLTDEELGQSVPFREVYIHALVRDAERQKMSKTKGNVLDPIQVIEKYGTDATRFTLAAMSSPGTDIAFSESRTEGYRAFANKIWNAARFMFMNLERLGLGGSDALAPENSRGAESSLRDRPQGESRTGPLADEAPRRANGIPVFKALSLEDRWILSRFNNVTRAVNQSFAAYRFDEAANSIYDFFWGEFCDWYLELIKPRLTPERGEEARIASTNLVAMFEAALRLLHPVMPFITEEIWHAIYAGDPPQKSLALAAYPEADEKQIDTWAETEMAILADLIVSVRNLRAELKVEAKRKTPIEIFTQEPSVRALIDENRSAIENDRQANVESLTFVSGFPANLGNTRHTARFEVRLVYDQKIDTSAECQRLKKELEKIEKGIDSGQRQLANEHFLAKAPRNVVENLRRQQQELAVLQAKTRSKLGELGCP